MSGGMTVKTTNSEIIKSIIATVIDSVGEAKDKIDDLEFLFDLYGCEKWREENLGEDEKKINDK